MWTILSVFVILVHSFVHSSVIISISNRNILPYGSGFRFSKSPAERETMLALRKDNLLDQARRYAVQKVLCRCIAILKIASKEVLKCFMSSTSIAFTLFSISLWPNTIVSIFSVFTDSPQHLASLLGVILESSVSSCLYPHSYCAYT